MSMHGLSQHPKSFDVWYEQTFKRFGEAYAALQEAQGTSLRFVEDLVVTIYYKDDPAIDEPLQILMNLGTEEQRKLGPELFSRQRTAAVLVGMTFMVRAGNAKASGNMDLAWSYLVDARLWCGVALANQGIDQAYYKTVKETRSKTGGKGAEVRTAKYQVVAEEAYRLATEKTPAGGWRSRSHAVKVIKQDVLAFAETKDVVLRGQEPGDTIDKWLADIDKAKPTAERLFPEKKRNTS